MSEKVVIRQKNNFETEILAADPHDPDAEELRPVEHVFALTPYGMLLASIGGCTAVLLTTYAQNHGLDLQEVELRLEFARAFDEDCQDCENRDDYVEIIEEGMAFSGSLTPQERQKLFAISQHCPIHKMVHHGVEIRSQMSTG